MASSRNEEIRRNSVTLLIMALFIFLSGCFGFAYYSSLAKPKYIKYTEDSNLDYEVCLKDNTFYEGKCLKKGNQYVSSLIDYIPATFSYNLSFPKENVEYSYSYKIEAEFDVKDKDNKKSLFTKKEVLYESNKMTVQNSANINYHLNIDYNKYNNILRSFIDMYNLDETTNNLKVSMYVNANIGNTDIEEISKDSVISLSIPLTRKTTNFDIIGTEANSETKDILIKNEGDYTEYLTISLACIAISLILFIYCYAYVRKNRSYKEIYDSRIRKITSTYDSYIQKINGNYPIGASQICKVVSFRDLLEIKDTVDKPLLMLENADKTGTFFLIPLDEGVIYTYALRIEDIVAEKNGDVAPDYDIDDITVDNKKEKKTYTVERIKEDIEKTQSIRIIDDENAIRGTKDSDEDLYEQLDKTSTFKVIKDSTPRKNNNRKSTKKKSKKKNS